MDYFCRSFKWITMKFPVKIFSVDKSIEISNMDDFRLFSTQYIEVKSAGGIVENERNEILLIYRHHRWDFPKGKIEEGENTEEAALREVAEETGLHQVHITGSLPSTYHTYVENGELMLKTTYWYNMYTEKAEKLIPQREEGITGVAWIPKESVPGYLTKSYASLIDLWQKSTR